MAFGGHPNIDVYDEEFNNYLNIAKGLIRKIKRGGDRRICTKWITKLCKLESDDPQVKKNRNEFFKYMLVILHRSLDEKPKFHEMPQYNAKHEKLNESLGGKTFMSRWSQDKRTYVAVKPIPQGGALVYMAVAKEPNMGWEYGRH
ncbi:uncharacterized protein [Onthophagus taurus]|uniref:uncharacterized protein n=1 Tax=Onthophagus taurus TaxID=166361 RepID=UPI000C201515|nr:uncharacterized protein LOC111426111 [Onthophagus taurus]